MSYADKIKEASARNKSRIVLAVDIEDKDQSRLLERSLRIVRDSHEYLCAVKINRQLVLALGLRNGVDSIVKCVHDCALPAIIDAKLNDVGHTNEFMMQAYMSAGFDAVIASPIVGWEGGLDAVFRLADSGHKGIILLVYMSNPGAEQFYSMMGAHAGETPRPVFEILTELAMRWKAHGAVVGATKPEIISRVRQISGDTLSIYSPGVLVQGGDPKKAVAAGADYLIVGRAIYQTSDPTQSAMEIRNATL